MVTLADFSVPLLLEKQKEKIISDYEEVGIIDRPDLFFYKHRAYVRQYFPNYKSPQDFNRNNWLSEAMIQRAQLQMGNISLAIGGETRSGKSSLAVIMFDKIMTTICKKKRYNIRDYMTYGNEDNISLRREIPSNTCILQDERKEEFGSGSRFRSTTVKTQNETLAKSKIHKIIVMQVNHPKLMVETSYHRPQICLYSWDYTMALAEPPEHIQELENDLAEMQDRTKLAHSSAAIKGEWEEYYTKENEFLDFLVTTYGPTMADYYMKSGRIHRALVFTITDNRPWFQGYCCYKTVQKQWVWTAYLVQKELTELHFTTGEAFGNRHRYYRDLILNSSAFEKSIKKIHGKATINRKQLKSITRAKCAGAPKSVYEDVLDFLISEDIPQRNISIN